MNVGQLVDILKGMPSNLEVRMWDDDECRAIPIQSAEPSHHTETTQGGGLYNFKTRQFEPITCVRRENYRYLLLQSVE